MPDLNRKSIHLPQFTCMYAVNLITVVLLIGTVVVDTGQALESDDYMMTLRKARNNEKLHPASGKLLRRIYKKKIK